MILRTIWLLFFSLGCSAPTRSSDPPPRRPGEPDGAYAKRVCLRSGGRSTRCLEYARALATGTGGLRRDTKAAGQRLRQLCLWQKDARACELLGVWLLGKGPLKKNPVEAIPLLVRACADERPRACYHLAMHSGGRFDRDALFRKACLGGFGRACPGAALSFPPGRSREPALRRGCRLGDQDSCVSLALWQLGTPASAPEALRILRGSCSDGSGAACLELALRSTMARRKELLGRACQLKHPPACGALGKLLMQESRGRSGPRPLTLLKRACYSGAPEACEYLGFHYHADAVTGSEQTRTIDYLFEACVRGRDASCLLLGEYVLTHLTDPLKRRWLVSRMRNGCERGQNALLCRIASEALSTTPAHRALAPLYAALGCAMGDPPSCLRPKTPPAR